MEAALQQTSAIFAERLTRAFSERSDAGDDVRVEVVNDSVICVVIDVGGGASLFEKTPAEAMEYRATLENSTELPMAVYICVRETDEPYGVLDMSKVDFSKILNKPMFRNDVATDVKTWLTCAVLDSFGSENSVFTTGTHWFDSVHRLTIGDKTFAVHIQATPTIPDDVSPEDHAELIDEMISSVYDHSSIFEKHKHKLFSHSEQTGISLVFTHKDDKNFPAQLKLHEQMNGMEAPQGVTNTKNEIIDLLPGFEQLINTNWSVILRDKNVIVTAIFDDLNASE